MDAFSDPLRWPPPVTTSDDRLWWPPLVTPSGDCLRWPPLVTSSSDLLRWPLRWPPPVTPLPPMTPSDDLLWWPPPVTPSGDALQKLPRTTLIHTWKFWNEIAMKTLMLAHIQLWIKYAKCSLKLTKKTTNNLYKRNKSHTYLKRHFSQIDFSSV